MSNHDEQEERSLVTRLAERSTDRRRFLGGAAAAFATGGMFGLSTWRGAAAAATGGSRRMFTPLAQDLPADAAPADQQTIVFGSNITVAKVLDFYEDVYQRPDTATDLFSDSLLR